VIVGVIALVAVLLAGLAAVLAGGSDDADGGAGSEVTAPPRGDVIGEVLDIEVTGEPLAAFDPSGDDPTVGTAAPAISGQGFDGTPLSIGGATDEATLAVFLAHWCPHCNDEIPELKELEANGEIPDDLSVIGISTAVAPDRDNYPPSQWTIDKGWPWPMLVDNEASEAFLTYGGSSFPFLVILDADGNVVARKSGQSSAADIKAWIDESLSSTS
jgi:thiol-disulfide isomerase/thioredoxin